MRFLTASKIRRAIRMTKYTIQAMAMFNRDLMPIIREYISNCKLMLKDIKQTEYLKEIQNDSNTEKK